MATVTLPNGESFEQSNEAVLAYYESEGATVVRDVEEAAVFPQVFDDNGQRVDTEQDATDVPEVVVSVDEPGRHEAPSE